jgi:hypothetical protein
MTQMLPAQLKPENFKSYPPEARSLVVQHLDLLRQLPLILVPLLLREGIAYDWRFPMERRELDQQLAYLSELSKPQLDSLLGGFSRLILSNDLVESNWIDNPGAFIEKLTAHLWATHQMDSFRSAAEEYATAWQAAKRPTEAPVQRLGIVVVGQGVDATGYPLFRKLCPKGVYFTHVSQADGLQTLLTAVAARSVAHPLPYGHWYIDGGAPEAVNPAVTNISYAALQPFRTALLNRIQNVIESGSAGPEALRTLMAQMRPQDIGLSAEGPAAVLGHFQLSLLTEGAGTQIFSTTFAQWAARETLRRAQPATLLVRFAPRQRQQPMNEMLSGKHAPAELDPEGSLIDADMAAYYTWLNQQRLSDADHAGFLVWFEGHNQAVAIGPSLPQGTVSTTPTTLQQILTWIS